MDSVLLRLQQWYASQCDGEWEHGDGVKIDTLDNPGWTVIIDIGNTSLKGKSFEPIQHGLTEDSNQDWLHIKVEDDQFRAFGDPTKLSLMLECFLAWAEEPA
jgi:hypothetical protein